MSLEIERKFLIKSEFVPQIILEPYAHIIQGYFYTKKNISIRVRLIDEQPETNCGRNSWRSFITIKSPIRGIVRNEFEFPIPLADGEELITLCGNRIVEKNRHYIYYGDDVWLIDAFLGCHNGLYLAEIELKDEGQEIDLPEWVGEEVSNDKKYNNKYLATH